MDSLLDDFNRIKSIDREGMGEIQERFPENCMNAIKRGEELKIPKVVNITGKFSINYRKPNKIIVAGMGGSAIGGNILKDWLRDTLLVQVEVCRDYHLPAYADNRTLVLVVSYSGNTEETISAFLDALERRCMIIVISSGGFLQEFCQKIGLPLIKLPEGYPPRCAMPYLFFPLVVSLEKIGILNNCDNEINETLTVLKQLRENVVIGNPTSKNLAKSIALDIAGSVPVIYGFGFYEGAALRIKTQFNENAKTPSISACFPELNHNETVGWTGREDLTKKFAVILIRDKDETQEIKARIEITRNLILDGRARKVVEIYSEGHSKLAKILSIIYIGDLTSFYLAILYGIDPTPVKIIDELKTKLEQRTSKIKELTKKFNEITGK